MHKMAESDESRQPPKDIQSASHFLALLDNPRLEPWTKTRHNPLPIRPSREFNKRIPGSLPEGWYCANPKCSSQFNYQPARTLHHSLAAIEQGWRINCLIRTRMRWQFLHYLGSLVAVPPDDHCLIPISNCTQNIINRPLNIKETLVFIPSINYSLDVDELW